MSRLIIKNLPNNVTEDKLRDLFSQKGEITDVQLKYTREGKFRNFGFIGYKSEEQADEARAYFDGSCIKTTRISVQACVPLGHSDKPQAWSRYAPDSSAYKKAHQVPGDKQDGEEEEKKLTKEERKQQRKKEKNDKIREILEKHKDDPLFAEFMEVHASKLDKAIWSNDAITTKTKKASKIDKEEIVQEENIEDHDSGVEKDEEQITKSNKSKKEKKKLANEAISDLEYMKSLTKKKKKSKVTEDADNADENDDENDDNNDEKKPPKKKKEPRNRLLFFVKVLKHFFGSEFN